MKRDRIQKVNDKNSGRKHSKKNYIDALLPRLFSGFYKLSSYARRVKKAQWYKKEEKSNGWKIEGNYAFSPSNVALLLA